MLPDEWILICGKTENLSTIYDEIYKDGPLLYEIEEFDDKGNCKIRYCRYILFKKDGYGNMNAEMIMGLVIISIVAGIMIIIGVSQFGKKENPVGFSNVIDPPKKEEISDVIQWNKKHGMIWIVYGICIELGFWLGYIMSSEVLEMVFMTGGVIIPLPFMVLRHRALEKEYKLN